MTLSVKIAEDAQTEKRLLPDTTSGERERLQQEILERLVVSFTASHVHQPDSPWFERRIAVMVEESRLFMRYIIPWWPPRLLLRKLVRILIAPVFAPQVEFNEAVRDVILELRQRADSRVSDYEEAQQTIIDLQGQVSLLTSQVESLSHALESMRRAVAVPTPSGFTAALSAEALSVEDREEETRGGKGTSVLTAASKMPAHLSAGCDTGNETRP